MLTLNMNTYLNSKIFAKYVPNGCKMKTADTKVYYLIIFECGQHVSNDVRCHEEYFQKKKFGEQHDVV